MLRDRQIFQLFTGYRGSRTKPTKYPVSKYHQALKSAAIYMIWWTRLFYLKQNKIDKIGFG